ncbi:hypothetical protein K1T35_06675 [Pseudonocardia sp. DSM 110487]|uniref:hypothetical protein n=1 Tax=Pseudonocardia sp. DSM 110487 TaxID=2865833 RepID=UPI001C6A5D83|nr:hypothetical protein [Pseudonocardia sp. DSM 110487]QYN36943.1 hypothetical protein K1T35_06675 [Pseudonocardia sp. DSM 110487]
MVPALHDGDGLLAVRPVEWFGATIDARRDVARPAGRVFVKSAAYAPTRPAGAR